MNKIPVHHFSKDDETSIPFSFRSLKGPAGYNVSVPHRHNFYEILIFIKGSGSHEIDFLNIPIEPYSIHFISPGQVHHLRQSETTEGFLLIFSREFFSHNSLDKDLLFEMPFLNNNTSHPVIKLTTKEYSEIAALIENIQVEYNQESLSKQQILASYVNILLLKGKNIFNRINKDLSPHKGMTQLVCRFKILIEKNYPRLHSVSEYSELLRITPEYLNEATKKVTGTNPGGLITSRIILEAKRLLLYSELTSKEIAFSLNYNDPSYFSRFFKKETGSTPNEFRAKNLEKCQLLRE